MVHSNHRTRPEFASFADWQAWEFDLATYGKAILSQGGKHVPLDTVFAAGAEIAVQLADNARPTCNHDGVNSEQLSDTHQPERK